MLGTFDDRAALVPRIAICGVSSALVAFLFFSRETPPIDIDEATARQYLAAEVAEARRLGFEVEQELPLEPRRTELSLDVEAGECLAVVATAWSSRPLDGVYLVRPEVRGRHFEWRPGTLSYHRPIRGLVGHVQWCATEARTVWAEVRRMHFALPNGAPSGVAVLLRAPTSRRLTYDRLSRGLVLRPGAEQAELRAAGPTLFPCVASEAEIEAGEAAPGGVGSPDVAKDEDEGAAD